MSKTLTLLKAPKEVRNKSEESGESKWQQQKYGKYKRD